MRAYVTKQQSIRLQRIFGNKWRIQVILKTINELKCECCDNDISSSEYIFLDTGKEIFNFIDDLLKKTGKVGDYDQKI